jgi:DNA-binding transcriptional regulator YdaS (Cro superfamily)
MNLKLYLILNNMTQQEFADILECSRSCLNCVMHGRQRPSKRLAADIERMTNGRVTRKELFDLYEKNNSLSENDLESQK